MREQSPIPFALKIPLSFRHPCHEVHRFPPMTDSVLRQIRFPAPDGLVLLGEVWPGGNGPEDAKAPPLVFLPGNGFPVQVYRDMVSGHPGCREVHALNPRGIGGSESPAAFESWDVLLNEFRAYVEGQLEAPVLLGGHSLGAMLSLRLAAEAPHLVSGLLLLEPIVRGGATGDWARPRVIAGRNIIERTRTRQALWPNRAEAEAAFTGHPAYAGWDAGVLSTYLAHALIDEASGNGSGTDGGMEASERGERETRLACPPWLEALIYETEPKREMFAYARAARCPAVLMRGEDSLDVSAAGLEELTRTVPVGVLFTVPGTHAFPMERPKETAHAVRQALAILSGRTDPNRP